MKSFEAFLLVLGLLGVFAKPQPNGFQSSSFKVAFPPSINTHVQTSAVENPTVDFPSFIPPTTVSESCHCLNTLVRPQFQNEIITVPTVDRIVRTVATPVIETINCNGGPRLTSFTDANNLLSAIAGSRILSEAVQGKNVGVSGRTNSGMLNRGNAQRNLSSGQSTNAFNGLTSTANANSFNLIATPIFALHSNTIGRNVQDCSNIFKNFGFPNGGRISSLQNLINK